MVKIIAPSSCRTACGFKAPMPTFPDWVNKEIVINRRMKVKIILSINLGIRFWQMNGRIEKFLFFLILNRESDNC